MIDRFPFHLPKKNVFSFLEFKKRKHNLVVYGQFLFILGLFFDKSNLPIGHIHKQIWKELVNLSILYIFLVGS